MGAASDGESSHDDREFDCEDNGSISSDSRRLRSSKACDKCNKRKVKCDANNGNPCSNCVRAGIQCIQSRPQKRRGPRPGYIVMLENRLAGLENVIKSQEAAGRKMDSSTHLSFLKKQKMSPPSTISFLSKADTIAGEVNGLSVPSILSHSRTETPHSIPQSSPATAFFLGSHLQPVASSSNPNSSAYNIDVSSELGSSTLANARWAPQLDLPMQPMTSSVLPSAPLPRIAIPPTYHYPSQSGQSQDSRGSSSDHPYVPLEVRDTLLKLFFQDVLQWYPYLPEAYMREQANSSTFLLHSILGMTLSHSPPEFRTPDLMELSEALFLSSCNELPRELEQPSITTVLALVLLFSFCAGAAAWMYLTMSIRIALDLRLNRESPADSGESFSARSVRRNVWWICYVSDRFCAAGGGSPLLIKDEECLVKLPQSDMDIDNQFDHEPHRIGENPALQIGIMSCREWYVPAIANMSLRGYFLLLVKIYGKVIQFEARVRDTAQRYTDEENEYCLASLNASLSDWLGSLPFYAKDATGQMLDHEGYSEHVLPGMAQLLHLLFNCVMITLHRPKMMEAISLSGILPTASTSSFKVCLHAANSNGILIARILAKNPLLVHIAPYTSQCVYTSGIVHATTAKLTTDASVRHLAHENLKMHIRALKRIAQCSATAIPRAKLLIHQWQSLGGLTPDDLAEFDDAPISSTHALDSTPTFAKSE
ncbi:hypothetical protein BSLG_007920 [Batrachochytrium salamandrivorans]|nr:hypothetical protein BSLG_007920 [Batrachochytrium salamandrivorans]